MPPSTTLVFDTSPLQAVFRAGVLPAIRGAFERTIVPAGVFEETRAALTRTAPGRVPDLQDFPWIEVVAVAAADIAAAGAVPAASRRATETYRWFNRTVDRPDVEAILAAKQAQARAVIENHNGMRCAVDFGVEPVSVAALLVELERGSHVRDAHTLAGTILATGYYSKELWWLSLGLRSEG